MATGDGGAVGKKVEGEIPLSESAKDAESASGLADRGTSGMSRILDSERGEATEDFGEGKDTSAFGTTKLSEVRGDGGAVTQK